MNEQRPIIEENEETVKQPSRARRALAALAVAAVAVGGVGIAGKAVFDHVEAKKVEATQEQDRQAHDGARAIALPYHTLKATEAKDHKLHIGESDPVPEDAPRLQFDHEGDSRTQVSLQFKGELSQKAKEAMTKYKDDDHVTWEKPTIAASIVDKNNASKFNGAMVPAGNLTGDDANHDGFLGPDEVTGADIFPRGAKADGTQTYGEGTQMGLYVENSTMTPFKDQGQHPEDMQGDSYLATLTMHDGAWQIDKDAPQLPDHLSVGAYGDEHTQTDVTERD